MKCINCGCELPEGSKFCFSCGMKQPEAVKVPVVEEPVYEEPAVEEPVYEEPIVEEPVYEEPVYEEPIVEEPVYEEPVYEEPIVEEPVYKEPVYEEPVVEEPVYEEPVYEEPVYEEPVYEEPIVEGPVYEEPAVEEPVYEEPAVEEPVVEESVYEEPAAEEPTPEPDLGVKFCPHCGAKNDGDAVFCSTCGKNMNVVAIAPESVNSGVQKKKVPVKLIAGAVAAVAVIVVGGKIIGGLVGDKENPYLAYVKDGDINQVDLEHYKKKPVEYEGRYGDIDYFGGSKGKVTYSKDGKYIFYPTGFDADGGSSEFRLNMQKVGKKKDSIKIDNSVRRYDVLENNKVIYIKSGNETLYLNDKKGNKEKIASDVEQYYIDEKEENIVWVEYDNGKYSVYQQDLALKKDKKALAKDVDDYKVSSDLKQILVQEEDTLYVINNFKEKDKISSGVAYSISGDEKGEYVYYLKDTESTLKAADLVEDDCAESDAAMAEPNRDNFKVEKVEKNAWTGKYEKVETVDYEKYNEAYDAYSAKQNRDSMRENLAQEEVLSRAKELYCYKDGKETLVDPAFSEGYSYSSDGVIVFSHYNMEEVPKIKLSEINYTGEVENKYYESLEKAVETCVYTGGKVVALEEVLTGATIDEDKKKGYGIKSEGEGEERETTLISFSVDSKADGKCEVVAEDIERIEAVKDGKVYYMADMDGSSGELYCNDENIDSDVKSYTLDFVDDVVIYAVDYDSEKGRATLKMYDGKKDTTIADDVFSYYAIDEKKVAVLVDYSLERYRGDLKFYRGKDELAELDEDVNFIFGGTSFY